MELRSFYLHQKFCYVTNVTVQDIHEKVVNPTLKYVKDVVVTETMVMIINRARSNASIARIIMNRTAAGVQLYLNIDPI